MKLSIVLLLTGLITGFYTKGQNTPVNDKLGASLKLFLAAKKPDSRFVQSYHDSTYLPVVMELSSKKAASILRANHVIVHTVAGTVVTASMPAGSVQAIALLPEVMRIELPLLLRKTDETMKQMIHASQVHDGVSPLTQAYMGKDVMIGIVDDGVDVTHPDFYTPTGECRIKYLWNMDYESTLHPAGFDYGYEWTNPLIKKFAGLYNDQKAYTGREMQAFFGSSFHGTSVTGLAAGNNGVAPEADIVVVAFTAFADTVLKSDRVIDAISYIAGKAAAENKKCVINLSFGVSDGAPHDGKSLVEKAIDNLCYENSNLLVCVSAGNNGNNWKHWGGFPIDKDSSYSFFYNSGEASLYFSIPVQYRDSIAISVAESNLSSLASPNISRDSIFYQTPFYKVKDLQSSAAPASVYSIDKKGIERSLLTFVSSPYDKEYDELILKVNSIATGNSQAFDPHMYRFIIKGSGTVHAWFPFLNLHPLFPFDNNPLPGDPAFHLSDNNYTTGIPSNGFTVLSTGAYNIRTCFVNLKKRVVNQYPACQLTYFTSHGPTLDGRIKPDLIAPGDNVFAPRSRFDDYFDYDFIIDTNTVSFGGTSASSPIVAGAAALLWQKFPSLPRDSIKALLKNNTQKDNYTEMPGPTPNNLSGWGKLDVFKAMSGVALAPYPCETVSTCVGEYVPPPVIVDTPINIIEYKLYPNPAGSYTSLRYRSYNNFTIQLYDSDGRKLFEKFVFPSAPPGTGRVNIPTGLYSNGIYFVRIVTTGADQKTVMKLVIVH